MVLAAARSAGLLAALAPLAAAQVWIRHDDVPKVGDGLERRAASVELELLHELRFGAAGFPALTPLQKRALHGLGFAPDGSTLFLGGGGAAIAVTVATGASEVKAPPDRREMLGVFAVEPRLALAPPLARAGAPEAQPFPFGEGTGWLSPSGGLGMVLTKDWRLAFADVLAAETLGAHRIETGSVGAVAWNRRETRIAVAFEKSPRPGIPYVPPDLLVLETTGRTAVRVARWRAGLVRAVEFAPDGGALFWADDQLHRTRLPDGRTLENADAGVVWLCAPSPAVLLAHDGRTLTAWVGPRLHAVKSARLVDPAIPGDVVLASAASPARDLVAFATATKLLVYRVVP